MNKTLVGVLKVVVSIVFVVGGMNIGFFIGSLLRML